MRIFTCSNCSKIHLEIGNTQIHFKALPDLKKYLETLDSIDATYYEAINRKKGLARVIILPLDTSGAVHIGFTMQEFDELKAIIRNYLLEGGKCSRRPIINKKELMAIHWN